MNHIGPNPGTNMVTPTNNQGRGGIQSLTIETGTMQQHPASLMTNPGATSPQNAANNPQLRYKNESMFN